LGSAHFGFASLKASTVVGGSMLGDVYVRYVSTSVCSFGELLLASNCSCGLRCCWIYVLEKEEEKISLLDQHNIKRTVQAAS
jgi:hypothetical protein